jgi:hypothetical protein
MNPVAFLFCVALGLLTMAAIGCWIAVQKGRPAFEGWLLAFLLGPLGLLIEALLPNGWDRGGDRPVRARQIKDRVIRDKREAAAQRIRSRRETDEDEAADYLT